MNNKISAEDFVSALNDCFNMGKEFSFIPTGNSMTPTINGTTDKVTLSQKPKMLKKYDIVMYRRKNNGMLVLHRLVDILSDGTYVMSGDSQYYYENGITYDDVIAVMTSYEHNGRVVYAADFSFKFNGFIILSKKKAKILLSRIYHKIFR